MNQYVTKRDGSIVEFDKSRIERAVLKAMKEGKQTDETIAKEIANQIEKKHIEGITVEEIERAVIKLLYAKDLDITADTYADYKAQKKMLRASGVKERYHGKFLSCAFLNEYKHADSPFQNELGRFVYYRTYSRPIPEEHRREDWWETCFRVVEFNMSLQLDAMKRQGVPISEQLLTEMVLEAQEIYSMMFSLKLFPSGRSLWIGGSKSSITYPLSNFNCSFVTIDSLKKFSEIFFVLMLGTGVGLSVERQYVALLPKINSKIQVIHHAYEPVEKSMRKEYTELKLFNNNALEIEIGDSKFGWTKSIELFFDILSSKQYSEIDYIFINYNNVRPEGEPLKTFGGYASGHNNIKQMFEKIYNVFRDKHKTNALQWQTMKPIDCLDVATIIAENVVSGGVRRSAEITFCDFDEEEVLSAKANLYRQDDNGNWIENKQILNRALSNNTVIYKEKPTRTQLHEHFKKLKVSGEPAFANFAEMKRRRDDVQGGNPCFEIMLRDRGVCNLTENNLMYHVLPDGTFDRASMMKAQRYSARIGYRMASIELELHEWNLVNAQDRLTGCSITGVMDFKNATKISDADFILLLQELREVAHQAANELADLFRMNHSKLITTVKPSGTISLLPTVSSGVHFSHSPYYIRRVRVNAQDPIAKTAIASGFDWSPEVGQDPENPTTVVFSFPVKSPMGKTKYDVSALEQLELYKVIMQHYVDHNASNTVHVRPHEWDLVEQWVFDNWDCIVGISFLSLDDSFYQLLPYESITEETYNELVAQNKVFNTALLRQFENFGEEHEVLDSDCESGVCPVR